MRPLGSRLRKGVGPLLKPDFLGTGWSYRLVPVDPERGEPQDRGVGLDQEDQIAEVSGELGVRQAIWLILGTAVGERMGRPTFGCRIHDLVFAPASAATMGEASQAVAEALTTWEPRIEVLGVDTSLAEGRPNLLVIDIHYRIRTTRNRYNLVYPFYLSA
jgi:phage baseplate assembly protein W